MSLRVSALACWFALSCGWVALPAAASPDKLAPQPVSAQTTSAGIDVAKLYAQHCAACHAPNRLGAMGPALLPDNLGRLRKVDAVKVIAEGRTATQMAGFAAHLSKDEIAALTDWITPRSCPSRAGPTTTSAPRASSM